MAATTAAYQASRRRRQLRNTAKGALFHLIVIAIGVVMIYPLLWILASSFKGPSDIWTNTTSLIPRDFTTENYTSGWNGFAGVSFTTFYRSSLFVTSISTIAAVFSSAVVAYVFARIRFVGQRFWFALMLATMM
ncbi:MAG: carbohydrate ABC transporter permease, partial [Anaerolineae bacterium]|nr:carbohydrate ABC transporter permease [Anaerolineae bacterium]